MSNKSEIYDDRTFVEIHMMQTIDGKTTGNFWRKPDVWQGIKDYGKLIPKLNNQGFAMGRVSMEAYSNEKPNLSKYKTKEKLEHKDYIVPLEKGAQYYLASYDSKGTLGFKKNVIDVNEWLNDGSTLFCQIIEVLTDKVSNEYLHYCRERGISYTFCGKEKIDIKISLQKLKNLFKIDKMLLQGGPVLDGSFIKEDLIDGISIIISPCTSEGEDTLFNPSKYVEFKLVEFKELSNSNMWLRHLKK